MAKAGRKRKPTALKLIEGNPGKRPLNEAEPAPAPVFNPDPPDTFTEVEAAKWREVTAKLAACRVLTDLDLDALEIYVRNWCAMMEALRDIALRGKLLRSPTGAAMWNPSWSHYKHAERVCRSLQSEFGMTPSTRSGITADAGDDGRKHWTDF